MGMPFRRRLRNVKHGIITFFCGDGVITFFWGVGATLAVTVLEPSVSRLMMGLVVQTKVQNEAAREDAYELIDQLMTLLKEQEK